MVQMVDLIHLNGFDFNTNKVLYIFGDFMEKKNNFSFLFENSKNIL